MVLAGPSLYQATTKVRALSQFLNSFTEPSLTQLRCTPAIDYVFWDIRDVRYKGDQMAWQLLKHDL